MGAPCFTMRCSPFTTFFFFRRCLGPASLSSESSLPAAAAVVPAATAAGALPLPTTSSSCCALREGFDVFPSFGRRAQLLLGCMSKLFLATLCHPYIAGHVENRPRVMLIACNI